MAGPRKTGAFAVAALIATAHVNVASRSPLTQREIDPMRAGTLALYRRDAKPLMPGSVSRRDAVMCHACLTMFASSQTVTTSRLSFTTGADSPKTAISSAPAGAVVAGAAVLRGRGREEVRCN